MHECSRLEVGDDTSVDCHYRYETAPRCFDNTSRQVGVSFGSREDALREAERRASRLREDHRRKERQ
jgi:hypothetical protein